MYSRRQDVATKKESFPTYLPEQCGMNRRHYQEMRWDSSSLQSSSSSSSISAPSSSYNSSKLSLYPQFVPAMKPRQLRATPTLGSASSINVALRVSSPVNNGTNHIYGDFQFSQQAVAAAATAAKRQLTLAVATGAAYEQPLTDEDQISQSLKQFAMKASNNETERNGSLTPLDSIRQEFAGNGVTTDEMQRNRYEQSQAAINAAPQRGSHYDRFNQLCQQIQQHQLQQQQIQQNLNELHHNVLRMAATSSRLQTKNGQYLNRTNDATNAAAFTVIAAGGVDNNANSRNQQYFNYNNNNKLLLPKRYNGRNDVCRKFTSVKHCVFCENNREPEAVVKSHSVRDAYGRVLCPKLRTYICPICKQSGDNAHTLKYCPQKPIVTMEDAINAEALRLAKSAYINAHMKH